MTYERDSIIDDLFICNLPLRMCNWSVQSNCKRLVVRPTYRLSLQMKDLLTCSYYFEHIRASAAALVRASLRGLELSLKAGTE